ncbi:Derlin-1 [Zostera marina]|uniref:Derlin n=1 Tax=Zostera marina TaxID=29655 RepID=A0A0K9Q1H4_ZOSMR|nr:Derlin-1 [Zostera marina]
MSSPGEFYKSLPPISKAFGTLCFVTTVLVQFSLLSPVDIALLHNEAFFKFQVWRFITNFFFLGVFSFSFAIQLLFVARYGVQLEKDSFNGRTADFLWMMIFGALSLLVLSTVPLLRIFFLGSSMVFMLIYIWSREYHNTKISIYGIFQMKAFYFPWAMLALNVIFGNSIIPDLLGLLVGHLYYFLAILHPLSGGKNILATPLWVHKLVARFHLDTPTVAAPFHTTTAARSISRPTTSGTSSRPTTSGTSGAFTGRSYRLNS